MTLAHWATDQIERLQLGAPLWVGPIGEIALSLDLHWEPERLFMVIVNLYADESYNDDIFVMGGYVAKLGQWNRLEGDWKRLLKQARIPYFHSKEMVDRDNAFKDWTDQDEIAFCSHAEKLGRKRGLTGFVQRIDWHDYRTHYRQYNPVRGFHYDSIYGLAFRYILAFIPDFVNRSLGRNDVVINAILENSTYFGDGLRVWNDLKKRFPEFGRLLGTCIPGDKKIPGLQVSDALATGAYRLEKSGDLDLLDIAQATTTIADLHRRKLPRAPAIRCQATPEQLRELKDGFQALKEHRRAHWEKTKAERQAILMPDPAASG
jgi:hypothetical protein